jgi:hypothetical protein
LLGELTIEDVEAAETEAGRAPRYWLHGHGNDIAKIPAGSDGIVKAKGWPRPEVFEYNFRNQLFWPIEFIQGEDGLPRMRVEDPNP